MNSKDGFIGLNSKALENTSQTSKSHVGWGVNRQVEDKEQKEETFQSGTTFLNNSSVKSGQSYLKTSQSGLQQQLTGVNQNSSGVTTNSTTNTTQNQNNYAFPNSNSTSGVISNYKHSSNKTLITSVEIDISVMLRIIKHCIENYPHMNASGQLLGMEYVSKLEITTCFQLPTREDLLPLLMTNYSNTKLDKAEKLDLEERVMDEIEKYQNSMLDVMHEIRSDCFVLGWYQIVRLDDFQDVAIISNILSYHNSETKNAVLLTIDPDLLYQGKKNAFRAYTLNSDSVNKLKEDQDSIHVLKHTHLDEILTELPIYIKYPVLSEAFLLDWISSDVLQSTIDYSELTLNSKNSIDICEKSLLNLADSIDALSTEQERLFKSHRDYNKQQYLIKQMVERRRVENEQRKLKGENPLPLDIDSIKKVDPPDFLPFMLVSKYVESQCTEINNDSKNSLCRILIRNINDEN
ncbi:hypothetical protein FG386_001071 [Cryptosporidium ryanae]|uniref:uncharacterized protein n=1 Tax=Cryptosporidium ryanae TaxID=515981 RepID=UPI00351AAAC5|nr:hypothetical protein FG386_001071 [Cryptosporidium ryanae]